MTTVDINNSDPTILRELDEYKKYIEKEQERLERKREYNRNYMRGYYKRTNGKVAKEFYKNHKEELKRKQKEYYQKNKQKIIDRVKRNQAKKKQRIDELENKLKQHTIKIDTNN